MALAVPIPALGGVCPHLSGLEHAQSLRDVLDIVRMNRLLGGECQGVVRGIAQHALKDRVGHQPTSIQSGDHHADRGVFERLAVPLFAGTHCPHRAAPVIGRQTNRDGCENRGRQS